MKKKVMYMRCATNMHMGAENEIGFVDMPIQREKHTGIPKMESSGIKGVLSREMPCKVLFGSGIDETGEEYAGKLRIYDGRVLLFPVQSGSNTFVYITCPFVLQRYWNEIGESEVDLSKINNQLVGGNKTKTKNEIETKISFGEFSFRYECVYDMKALADIKASFINYLKGKEIVIVSDDIFSYFMEMGTVVRTRNKIDSVKGVAENLFSVEYLPEETILYSILEYRQEDENVFGKLEEYLGNIEYLQFGGEESLGKGITQIKIGAVKEKNEN